MEKCIVLYFARKGHKKVVDILLLAPMKKLIYVFFLLPCSLYAQATLHGTVKNNFGEPVAFANVALYQKNELITGTQTDLYGKYLLQNLDKGEYRIEASFIGMVSTKEMIKLNQDTLFQLDLVLIEATTAELITCRGWPPQTKMDQPVGKIDFSKLRYLPTQPNLNVIEAQFELLIEKLKKRNTNNLGIAPLSLFEKFLNCSHSSFLNWFISRKRPAAGPVRAHYLAR